MILTYLLPTDCHFRGKDLVGRYISVSYVGTMCSDEDALGLIQDIGRSVQDLGAAAAHELGHILNMLHDDLGKYQY